MTIGPSGWGLLGKSHTAGFAAGHNDAVALCLTAAVSQASLVTHGGRHSGED